MQVAINKFVDYYQVLHFVSKQANLMTSLKDFVPDPENPDARPSIPLLNYDGGI